MKKIYIYYLLLFFSPCVFAQLTPLANGVSIAPSLTFSTSVVNPTSVVFNPNVNFYYIVRAGNSVFPLETLSDTGIPLFQTTAGFDTRGMWWNPNTNQVERNGFASGGWTNVNLDISGHALNTFSTIFSGQNQPDPQSVGAYDDHTNTVLFYNGGSTIFIYNRNTGLQTGTLTLTGTSLASVNTNTVIYTGQFGFEIGLLDYVNKRVLLFNRLTGVFSAMSQLPTSAITNSVFRFSYANNRVWLMNSATATWDAYMIWNIVLPTQELRLNAFLYDNQEVKLTWDNSLETGGVSFYELERSENKLDFSKVYTQSPLSNKKEYSYFDKNLITGTVYYRVKTTYIDGTTSYSNIESITTNSLELFSVYPNPVQSELVIVYDASTLNTDKFLLYNELGQLLKEIPFSAKENVQKVNIQSMSAGVYFLKAGKKTLKIIKE